MKQYSFLNTVLLVDGVEIEGYDEGDDVIQLERTNDSATDVVGADGTMTVSVSADRTGTCTFRIMQTSDSNTYLSGLIAAQENGAFAPVFVQFKDTTGLDLASGTQGYITRPANMKRGTNAQAQEWVIKCERLDLLHGGG